MRKIENKPSTGINKDLGSKAGIRSNSTQPSEKNTTVSISGVKLNSKISETKKENIPLTKNTNQASGSTKPAGLVKPTLPKSNPKNKEIFEEEKKEPVLTGFTIKPSAKLTSIKTADPFASKNKLKTNSFAYVYNAGGIPCRIDHGSINNRLKWNGDVVIENLPYDPLLITCFEGLIEEQHPFNFIAKEAIKELLEVEGAAEKTIPLLSRIAMPLRNALGNPNSAIFENALASLKLLSNITLDALNDHVNGLLGQLVRRMNDKKYREKIIEVLHTLEENGGQAVVKIIKAKIPTYTNVN